MTESVLTPKSSNGLLVAGIGELVISSDPGEVLITYSLGSCIGVSAYDPQAGVGGLIHCMLPTSKIEPTKAKECPCRFTDTGIVKLLQTVMEHGGDKNRLIIKVAGAGSPMDAVGRFKIGERNVTMLRKVLWKNNLLLTGEDLGGTDPRTMSLYLVTGRATVKKHRQEVEL